MNKLAIRLLTLAMFTMALIAVPLAFLVAGAIGVLIERSIIRFLYGRPLETLLATIERVLASHSATPEEIAKELECTTREVRDILRNYRQPALAQRFGATPPRIAGALVALVPLGVILVPALPTLHRVLVTNHPSWT